MSGMAWDVWVGQIEAMAAAWPAWKRAAMATMLAEVAERLRTNAPPHHPGSSHWPPAQSSRLVDPVRMN